MSLRRLLGLSAAAVSGRPRRPLATAATHPPWAIVKRWAVADESAPGALVQLDHPSRLSCLAVPKHLLMPRAIPGADSYVTQLVTGSVCAVSADSLLLLSYFDERWVVPVLTKQGAAAAPLRKKPTEHAVSITHLICNPVTGQLSRLSSVQSYPAVSKLMCGKHTGLLTRAGRGHDRHGLPDRFAVAELQGGLMVWFLSETGKWESVPVSTCQLLPARRMVLDREVVVWMQIFRAPALEPLYPDSPVLTYVLHN